MVSHFRSEVKKNKTHKLNHIYKHRKKIPFTRVQKIILVLACVLVAEMSARRNRGGSHSRLSPSQIEHAREAINFLSSLAETEDG